VTASVVKGLLEPFDKSRTIVRDLTSTEAQVPACRHVLIQGYLAHKKQRPPRTLPYEYTQGPMVVLGGGGAVSDEQSTRCIASHMRDTSLSASHMTGASLS